MRTFLTARWIDLVMRNHAVDPALLAPYVPAGTALDLWQGEALVSVVGFQFRDTRVLGVPVPWHRHFEEVNLRFYVRREVNGEIRRAVTFISELVPRAAIAWSARTLYNEPYRALPMRHAIETQGSERTMRYEWRERDEWTRLEATTVGPPTALVAGSEAEFITEHYWGYTQQRDDGTVEYEVKHPSWRVWEARESSLTGDLSATYGPVFAGILAQPPRSVFVAEGSSVSVSQGRRI